MKFFFIMVFFITSLLLFISFFPPNNNQYQLNSHPSYYSVDEELVYTASWSGISIGTIRLKTLPVNDPSGTVKRKAVAYIDSRSGLPFIDVHMVAYADMDSSFNSVASTSYEKRSGEWQKVVYHYSFSKKMIFVEESYQETLDSPAPDAPVYDTLSLDKNSVQDGISLVYLARYLIRRQDSISFPTVSNLKVGETVFYTDRTQSTLEIEAWEKPIHVVELAGKMKLEGIFGLKGDFKVWFSDDSAAIPMRAEMKVILGSVKVELKQWSRQGWQPPE